MIFGSLIHLLARALAVAVLVPVADVGLLLALVFLPDPPLVRRMEVHHVERVLEVDEEVARILRRIILGPRQIDARVLVLVRLVDFLLQLLLVILDWQILHAKICAEVLASLDLLDIARVLVLRV